MKKLVLPRNRTDYNPEGIYAMPKDQRRSAFDKLMEKNSRKELTKYRINARKKMRGEL